MDLFLIEGIDNLDIPYGQFHAEAARACMSSGLGCTFGHPDPEKVENYGFEVRAQSDFTEIYYLQVEGGSYFDITRVDIGTDWIDIEVPIVYRTDSLQTVTGRWRLER